jgi:hypothetical protein
MMRFEISNVDYPRNYPPCEGCYQLPEAVSAEDSPWFIDIASLDDLLALMNRVKNDLILSPCGISKPACPWVRIYDGYNE